MSKYEPLGAFLKAQGAQEVPMTFEEVEHILGTKLPPSAYKHRPWWANEAAGHVHAKAWLQAGFETERVDMEGGKLVFKRKSATAKGSGMSDAVRTFVHAEGEGRKPVGRHPMIGAMKGTITIEPGYDLAQSPFSDEELAEMEANLERTADLIEQGMSKTK